MFNTKKGIHSCSPKKERTQRSKMEQIWPKHSKNKQAKSARGENDLGFAAMYKMLKNRDAVTFIQQVPTL